ncbi:allergen Asp F3 [Clostridium botulinum B str. Osaka05]|uniref:Allergen Asp F3 n=1 Tax=Clostridium botulinum B str. Osaka05 TaxID=1407017 RepID=A0A060N515_CLOBO|nr:hypothetical protein [Clostridium botulinum]BAO04952.1 allergen Asp F3 [Clostridium botulinum B str. Osaka05]
MSRKKMEKLAEQLKTMYLTENPINFNDDRDWGYKYFICFHNTHTVVRRASNIPEMVEVLQDVIKNGVDIDGHIFY